MHKIFSTNLDSIAVYFVSVYNASMYLYFRQRSSIIVLSVWSLRFLMCFQILKSQYINVEYILSLVSD